jgi:hypothetical protein
MKFLCLAYEEEATLNDLEPAAWDELRREIVAYVEILQKSGHLILTNALESTRMARDRDEAITLASRWPSARLGSIEVRPIEETLPQERRD